MHLIARTPAGRQLGRGVSRGLATLMVPPRPALVLSLPLHELLAEAPAQSMKRGRLTMSILPKRCASFARHRLQLNRGRPIRTGTTMVHIAITLFKSLHANKTRQGAALANIVSTCLQWGYSRRNA